MINKPINAVKKFHKAYELGINNSPTVDIDKDLIKLRFNLMKEENEEYFEAARKNDIIEGYSIKINNKLLDVKICKLPFLRNK